ncbi:unnamed protein product [Prunus armeniaca]|uniref:Uncharacterized protein n=1 Tax=Prunus armeniaca TaxID=36596 RepID=A0A6J5UCI9_PRUAR|nr:unnamed protein product [Prunus armeniaca]
MLVFDEVEHLDWIAVVSESPYYWRRRCVPKDYKALFGREKFLYLETEHYKKSKVGSLSVAALSFLYLLYLFHEHDR